MLAAVIGDRFPSAACKVAPFNQGIGIAMTGNFVFFGKPCEDGKAAEGRLSVVSGQWSVVSGQWSVVSGQWSVVSGQWSVVRRETSSDQLTTDYGQLTN